MSVVLTECLSDVPIIYEVNNDPFFEGAEKLLEIWFYKPFETNDEIDNNNLKSDCKILKQSLRNIPRDEIVKMLDYANCHILHSKSNTQMDSYVLRYFF